MKFRQFVGDDEFEGNRYPVYATAQIKVGGVKPEEVFIFAFITTVFDMFSIDVFIGAMVGGFVSWQYRKYANSQAPGMLQYAMSLAPQKWMSLPWIGFLFKGLSRAVVSIWKTSGSIPPHNSVKYYEP